MRRILILTFSLSCLLTLIVPSVALEQSHRIQNIGTIHYPSTSFVVDWNFDSHPSEIPTENGLEDVKIWHPEQMHIEKGVMRITSSLYAIETVALGLIHSYPEFWIQIDFKLASDFKLATCESYQSGVSEGWYIFQDIISEWLAGGTYYNCILQISWNDLTLNTRWYKRVYGEVTENYFNEDIGALERNRWYVLKYHVIRDTENGLIEVWLDNNKIFEWTGQTQFEIDEMHTNVARHYQKEPYSNTIYWDNLKLWTG